MRIRRVFSSVGRRPGRAAAVLVGTVLLFALLFTGVFGDSQETATFGVDGYSSGSNWEVSEPKPLIVETDNLLTDQGGYTIRITVAKGMKLESFLWNSRDTEHWIRGEGVKGTPVEMDDATSDFFRGGALSVDAQGNTVLEYLTHVECEGMRLTDKIVVVPDEIHAYLGNSIENGVRFELVNSSNEVLRSGKVDVKIAGGPITNSSYSRKKFTAGQEDVHLYDALYYRYWDGTVRSLPQGTADVTLGIPTCVSAVTRVVSAGTGDEIPTEQLSFDSGNNTLTIRNVELSGNGRFYYSIYGDIADDARPGSYAAANTPIRFDYTSTYDGGTASYAYPDDFVSLSTYYVEIAEAQDVVRIADYAGNTAFTQFPEDYPSIFGKLSNFYTSNAQTDNQIATWSFAENTLDVIGVFFPTDSKKITVKSVTFDDGTTITPDLEFTTIQKICYVNTAALRDRTEVPAGAKYIRSITADCGTFGEAFSTGTWYGRPVGYFSQAVVDAGVPATIPFTFKINRADPQTLTVDYDPDGEFACLNIDDTTYSNASRTTESASFKAGDTIYARSKLGVGGNYLTSTGEPRFYLVVPKDMTFDPASVTVHDYITTSNSANPIKPPVDLTDQLVSSSGYVRDASGGYYQVYEFYVPGSATGSFKDDKQYSWAGHYNTSLVFDYELVVSETAETSTFDLGDYLMAGKGNLETEEFLPIKGANNVSTHVDTWDMNGNRNRTETDVISASAEIVTVLTNMNITVSGYLTQEGGSDAVHPYDPGSDGSNEVNVVEFMPATNADYHVIVSNTLVSIGDKCSVNAYIPIPNGSFSADGSTFTAINTDDSFQRYQFSGYQWPMSLRGMIENADEDIFDIIYYLDAVTLDANGEPSGTSTLVNPQSMTEQQLSRVVLVEISSKEGLKVPGGGFEFVLPLKVGATETQATQAQLNLTKNIFRPRYHREGGIGAIWVNGNYVAARLAVSSIGGYVFQDINGDGLWDREKEAAMGGVNVGLYDSEEEQIGEQTTDSGGKYSFTTANLDPNRLDAGDYTIRFTNPDVDGGYVFTKNHPATKSNYRVNSEAVGSADNVTASAAITLPYEGVLAGYQEYQNAGMYVDKVGGGTDGSEPDGIPDACQVRVNYEVDGGSIKAGQKTFEYICQTDGHGWLTTFDLAVTDPPQIIPGAGCVTDHWENSVNSDTSSDGRFVFAETAGGGSITVRAVCQEKNYTVKYDGNTETGSDVTGLPADQTKRHGIDLTLSSDTPERASSSSVNYYFTGWNTDKDGDGTACPPGSVYSTDADVTLYAQWVDRAVLPYDVYYYTEKTDSTDASDKDNYSLHSKETLFGEEGTQMSPVIGAITGFTCQESMSTYDPEDKKIRRESGTAERSKAEIYYSRNSSSVTFDANGGYFDDDPAVTEKQVAGKYESPVTTPGDPVRDGCRFMGWDKDVPRTMPEEPAVLKAEWARLYTVTFLNWNGETIGEVTGVEGSSVSAPDVPDRTGYRFTDWNGEVPETMPGEDVTLTALYSPITYRIEYTLNGGSVDGANPTTYTIESKKITLINPVKPGFTFHGWTGTDLTEASLTVEIPKGSTGDRRYTANWPSNAEYLVKHYKQNLEGEYPAVPDETETLHGDIGEQTGAAAKQYEGFTAQSFSQTTITDTNGGANPAVVEIHYKRNTYTVTWKNDDGSQLEKDENVMYGATPSYDGETPQRAGDAQHTYTFAGWDPQIATVTGDASYKAKYTSTVNKYTIRWLNDAGSPVKTETVEYGADMPEFTGTPPGKEADAEYTYIFSEWVPDVDIGTTVTGNVDFTPSYSKTKRKYSVRFVDEDGQTDLIDPQQVEYGVLPHYSGGTPAKQGDVQHSYTFAGWDPAITEVTGEAVYKARYTQTTNEYTIRWLDASGGEITEQTKTAEYGADMPEYTGTPPEKEADAEYTYSFREWVPDVDIGDTVTGNVTFSPAYDRTTRKYTIRFTDEDGSTDLIDPQDVEYGQVPRYHGEAPTKEPDAYYLYEFDGWDPLIGPVTGEQTYRATFLQIEREYGPAITQGDPPVKKVVKGDTPPSGDRFRFRFAPVSNTAGLETGKMPMPGGTTDDEIVVSLAAGQEHEFGVLTFTKPGEYVYSITEINDGLGGYAYDGSVYTVKYIVTPTADNVLTCERIFQKDGKDVTIATFEFDNTYQSPGGDPEKKDNGSGTADNGSDGDDDGDGSSGSSSRTGDAAYPAIILFLFLAAGAGIFVMRRRRS